jgi:hypothetical protein
MNLSKLLRDYVLNVDTENISMWGGGYAQKLNLIIL